VFFFLIRYLYVEAVLHQILLFAVSRKDVSAYAPLYTVASLTHGEVIRKVCVIRTLIIWRAHPHSDNENAVAHFDYEPEMCSVAIFINRQHYDRGLQTFRHAGHISLRFTGRGS
jgi:hypothetical protein